MVTEKLLTGTLSLNTNKQTKHANKLRLSGKKISLSDISLNVMRHSLDCLTTEVSMKTKLKLHSWERHETEILSQMFRACHSGYNFKIRPKFVNLSHKCPFNETAT